VTSRSKEVELMSISPGAPLRLMAAAAAPTATTTATGDTARRAGGATGASRSEDRELNRRFLAGAIGAGDFLLFVDDNFFESLVTGIANVFVDGHDETLSRKRRELPKGAKLIIPQDVWSSHHNREATSLALTPTRCPDEESRKPVRSCTSLR
jgi:hypothetical protein